MLDIVVLAPELQLSIHISSIAWLGAVVANFVVVWVLVLARCVRLHTLATRGGMAACRDRRSVHGARGSRLDLGMSVVSRGGATRSRRVPIRWY